MSVGYVMSGWENGRGLPVVCPPQSFLSQKADGQREISWLFRGFGDTVETGFGTIFPYYVTSP